MIVDDVLTTIDASPAEAGDSGFIWLKITASGYTLKTLN